MPPASTLEQANPAPVGNPREDTSVKGATARKCMKESACATAAAHARIIHAPDIEAPPAALDRITQVLRRKPKQLVADAGYWSETNI